jgi:hypothetical protein
MLSGPGVVIGYETLPAPRPTVVTGGQESAEANGRVHPRRLKVDKLRATART